MAYVVMNYTSLDNVKALAKMQGTAGAWISTQDDAMLNLDIAEMSQRFDVDTGIRWSHQTSLTCSTFDGTLTIDRLGIVTCSPKIPIINSLTSIGWNTTGDNVYQSITDLSRVRYSTDFAPGGPRIRIESQTFNPKLYRANLYLNLTIDTGYSTYTALPPDIERACARAIVWVYKVAYQAAPDGMAASDYGPVKISSVLPGYIQETIDKYKRRRAYA